MCGRFVSFTDPEGLVRFFSVDERRADDVPPSWNVAPTDRVHAVAEHDGRRVLVAFRWGLVPHWASEAKIGAKLVNARAETAAGKPAFRDALRRRRCIIPADGFYEWRAGPDGRKTPFFIRHADGTPLALAGLWSTWRDPAQPETVLRTCTILTTDAAARIRDLHTRMPVLLAPHAWQRWLDSDQPGPETLHDIVDSASDTGLTWHAVSSAVNTPRTNHPGLLEPVQA